VHGGRLSASRSAADDLVDLIPLWVPDPADQMRMLVENPNALYGFD
jgi:predicted TIM-barrel fold metal-dependent hydrolase